MEFVIILLIVLFIVLYRQSNGTSVYKFIVNNVETVYEKYAPYFDILVPKIGDIEIIKK